MPGKDENAGMTGDVERARAAFDRNDWSQARVLLTATEPLDAADLERLAVAAHLVGRDAESMTAWERAHGARVGTDDRDGAARCAFWLCILLLLRGEVARASGWLARAERLAAEADGPARGFVLIPACLDALGTSDPGRAAALATEIVATARRFGEPDLLALGLLGQGQAAIAAADTARGLRLLDEAMLGVAAGDVSPIPTGIVYCAVIESCMDAFDLRRAAEWTAALHGWCIAQPDLVRIAASASCTGRRSCRRTEHGTTPSARPCGHDCCSPTPPIPHWASPSTSRASCTGCAVSPPTPSVRTAPRWTRSGAGARPRVAGLAEGNVEAAVAAVRRMLHETGAPASVCGIRAAAVEILLAAGDVAGARAAAEELTRAVDAIDAPLLRTIADAARGAVLLAEDDAAGALCNTRSHSTSELIGLEV